MPINSLATSTNIPAYHYTPTNYNTKYISFQNNGDTLELSTKNKQTETSTPWYKKPATLILAAIATVGAGYLLFRGRGKAGKELIKDAEKTAEQKLEPEIQELGENISPQKLEEITVPEVNSTKEVKGGQDLTPPVKKETNAEINYPDEPNAFGEMFTDPLSRMGTSVLAKGYTESGKAVEITRCTWDSGNKVKYTGFTPDDSPLTGKLLRSGEVFGDSNDLTTKKIGSIVNKKGENVGINQIYNTKTKECAFTEEIEAPNMTSTKNADTIPETKEVKEVKTEKPAKSVSDTERVRNTLLERLKIKESEIDDTLQAMFNGKREIKVSEKPAIDDYLQSINDPKKLASYLEIVAKDDPTNIMFYLSRQEGSLIECYKKMGLKPNDERVKNFLDAIKSTISKAEAEPHSRLRNDKDLYSIVEKMINNALTAS